MGRGLKRARCFICGKRTKLKKRKALLVPDGKYVRLTKIPDSSEHGYHVKRNYSTSPVYCCSDDHYKLARAELLLASLEAQES